MMAGPQSRLRAAGAHWRLGRALALAGALVGLLAACGSDRPKPTALEPLTPKIAGRQVWQAKLDGIGFPLGVAVREGRFIVAGNDGTVLALEAGNGREVWRGQVGQRLSAGVGSDGRYAAVVTNGNDVVTLDAGREIWRARMPARTLTPPLVAGERVFVMSVDRVVHAFDARDGRRLWVLQRPGDALTLGQGGLLTAVGDTLVVGADASDRITAYRQSSGEMAWTSERLLYRGLSGFLGAGTSIIVGDFEGQVHFLDRDSGQPMLRLPTDGSPVVGTPVASGTTLLVTTRSGGLFAFRPE